MRSSGGIIGIGHATHFGRVTPSTPAGVTAIFRVGAKSLPESANSSGVNVSGASIVTLSTHTPVVHTNNSATSFGGLPKVMLIRAVAYPSACTRFAIQPPSELL